MSTVHAALIDYRFRMLPQLSHQKRNNQDGDFEKLTMDLESYFDLED